MNAQERYQLWLNSPDIDEETKAELRSIANDPQEIEERFYMELEFGTLVCQVVRVIENFMFLAGHQRDDHQQRYDKGNLFHFQSNYSLSCQEGRDSGISPG